MKRYGLCKYENPIRSPDIQELLLLLGIFEPRTEIKNLTALCEHLNKVNQTMEQVMLEVSNMREQIIQMNENTLLKHGLSRIIVCQAYNMKNWLCDIR